MQQSFYIVFRFEFLTGNFTSVCAVIFAAWLIVAALSLQHLPLTFPPTVFGGRSRTGSVPLPDSASTLSVTLWPLRPLWPATVNWMRKSCEWGWAHYAVTELRFLKYSENHLDMLEENTLGCQTELHHRNRQAQLPSECLSVGTENPDHRKRCKNSMPSRRTWCSPLQEKKKRHGGNISSALVHNALCNVFTEHPL